MIRDKAVQRMTNSQAPTTTVASPAPTTGFGPWPWRGLLAVLTAVVFWLAVMPAPPREIDTGWDKLNHMTAFLVLTFCGVWAHRRRKGPNRLRVGVRVALGAMAFGALIEGVQAFVPGRSSDGADLVADALGVLLGGLAAWGATAWWHHRRR